MSGLTILTSVFKALKVLWPFIAEMFFAGKSLKQIVMENKMVISLLTLLILSVLLNYFSFSKIYEIAIARRESDVQQKVLENKPPKDQPVAEGPPRSDQTTPSIITTNEIEDPHIKVRNRLEHIYQGK